MKGSSVVIPCSFYYPNEERVQEVKWVHESKDIYEGPFVFDSASENQSSVFQYIGNKLHNCSLKINPVQHNIAGNYMFRFITNSPTGKWTGEEGSTLKIVGKFPVLFRFMKSWNCESSAVESVEFVSKAAFCFYRSENVGDKHEWSDKGRGLLWTWPVERACDGGAVSSAFIWFKNGESIHEGPSLYWGHISPLRLWKLHLFPQRSQRDDLRGRKY